MSDYTQNTLFGPKDALSTGDPAKLIKGTEFDAEFSEIAGAISTKYDSGNIASNAVAAALADDTTLLTPAKLAYALANGTYTLSATSTSPLESRTLTAGAGLTGGGTLEADRTFNVGAGTGISVSADAVALSHLGLEALADPGADRLAFWDDSAGAFAWLTLGTNLSITGTTLNAAAGAGGADWGDIGGTLSNQTDLQNALNAKVTAAAAEAITPAADSTYQLGSSVRFWLNTYSDSYYVNAIDTRITRARAGQIAVDTDTVFTLTGSNESAKVSYSTADPVSAGVNGDMWVVYIT